MTANEGQAVELGLAVIVAYVGLILYILCRSAKARPVEDPTRPQGGRKLELMPARQSPDGFLRGGLPPAEGTLAGSGTNPNHERDETL
jgi:hypothetical protein